MECDFIGVFDTHRFERHTEYAVRVGLKAAIDFDVDVTARCTYKS